MSLLEFFLGPSIGRSSVKSKSLDINPAVSIILFHRISSLKLGTLISISLYSYKLILIMSSKYYVSVLKRIKAEINSLTLYM